MIKYLSSKLVKVAAFVALTGLSGVADAQSWSQAGPIYNAGRSRNMIVDKNDPSGNTMYVGSSSSGVFITTDGGANWNAVVLTNNKLNVSYIAQAVDGKIYVATGEGFLRPGQKLKAQPGTGLYVINGGNLDARASHTITGTVINRIACSPTNANLIAAATDKGIMISNDGGVNFNLAGGITVPTNASGQDVKFDTGGILYCSIGTETASAVPSKVWKSSDNTLTSFSQITTLNSPLLQDDNFGRIELAIAPSNNSVIYASCASKSAGPNAPASANLRGLFVSYDAGATWGLILQGSSQLDPLMNGETFGNVVIGGNIASGDYAQVIAVDPFDSDQLYIGSYQFYYWKRTGGPNTNPVGTWTKKGVTFIPNSQFFLARNIHDIKFITSGNSISKFFFVTDAGIYRSTDVLTGMFGLTSFQPFYKGLITGQFNSISIERYPLALTQTISASPNTATLVTPYIGFIGGTGGNGLNYFSGNFPNVTQEAVYGNGDIYQSEFSKILPNAAYFTQGSGKLFRSTDVRSSDPVQVDLLVNSKTQAIVPYDNAVNYNATGTPFKIWENYGHIATPPDSAVFYNDSLRFAQSMIGVTTLTTQTTFTFSTARPSKDALIDSIAIRTGTVLLPLSPPASNAPGFTGSDKKDITIKLQRGYTVPATGTIAPTVTAQAGPVVTASTSVVLNQNSLLDNISVTFTSAPFATKTQSSSATVPDFAAYYRVFCTVFYRYPVGSTVSVVDNKISTKTTTYSAVLTNSLSWEYGSTSNATSTITSTNAGAVTNPTFAFVSPSGTVNQSSPSLTVQPVTTTAYTIVAYGTYTASAKPVTHTLVAVPAGTATIPSPTYNLMPGNITQTNTAFVVTPTASTTYTILEGSTNPTVVTTSSTFSTIGASTYSLNPGAVSQASPVFTITVPTNSPITTYTMLGLSSNTVTGVNTSSTVTLPLQNVVSAGYFLAGIPVNNKPVKIAMGTSARMAMGYGDAKLYVSNAPLSLNNPLSMINVSANKCLTTDNAGNALFAASNTVAVNGTVTALEWSKNGSEIYYATNDALSGNKYLYRVSGLYAMMDSTAGSYSGKLHTNVFTFSNTVAPDGTKNNPRSPYRTALLGTYSKIITGISVTNDDKAIAVTFDDPTGNKIMYSTVADVRKCDFTNVNLVSKNGTGLPTTKVYCSLMEKSDNKKVFVGTDFGVYTTNDITAPSPTWTDANNNQLPIIQVFDIKQQVMRPWDAYNSGAIYAATNGRGVWINKDYQTPYYVGVEEFGAVNIENNMVLYPNPTNGTVFVSFTAVDGESATINVMDINGRIVKTENLGKLNSGDLTYGFETSELSSGMYIINISGTSGTKRVAKLVVTK